MGARQIDLEGWKRRELFEFYRDFEYPQFNVCFDLEVGPLRAFARAKGLSFYHLMVWASARAANAVEELRTRIRAGSVVLHDRVHPNFTFLREDETFGFCPAEFVPDPVAFCEGAGAAEERARALRVVADEPGRDDLLFLTCVPWISFTSISHPVKLGHDDSIPRLAWGRLREEGQRVLLPYSLQLNHALADGFHAGRFARELEAAVALLAEASKAAPA